MSVILPVSMSTMKDSGETFFIELYVLELRTGTSYIAATDENITYNGIEFFAVPFQRQDVVRSMDNISDSCEVSIADSNYKHLAYIMNGFDFRGVSCSIFRIQYPDSLSNPKIVQWMFSGYVDEPSYADGVFTCKIMSRFPEIQCPNRSFQLACNSEFGDEACGMSLSTEDVSITSVSGNVIALSRSYTDNYWKDGVAKVTGEARNIEKSSGNTITVNVNFLQEINGKTIELNRGCNKTREVCRKYNNMTHYGGFPAIPFESEYR